MEVLLTQSNKVGNVYHSKIVYKIDGIKHKIELVTEKEMNKKQLIKAIYEF